MPYKAAVIGLGQIGSSFDSDPKRREVWTHSGAYQACPATTLVAGADLDAGRRDAFRALRKVDAVYADWREMLAREKPDIVSVCTPIDSHHEVARGLAASGVKAIFLEKPMCREVAQAREVVEACRSRGVVLAVNHLRRWDPVLMRARQLVAEGAVGEVRSVVGWYSEKVYNIGTHLLDAMAWLAGPIESVVGERFAGASTDEETVSGYLSFKGGARGFVACQGRRESFVFELDVLGSKGRLRLADNFRRLELYGFEPSANFSGYEELAPKDAGAWTGPSGFPAAVGELAACLDGRLKAPSCSGEDGLAALAAARALHDSALGGCRVVRLEGVPA